MNLIRDHSAGAYAVDVVCLACNKRLRLSDAVIDTQGPPFRAYYHPACVPADAPVRRCNRWDCARPECQPQGRA